MVRCEGNALYWSFAQNSLRLQKILDSFLTLENPNSDQVPRLNFHARYPFPRPCRDYIGAEWKNGSDQKVKYNTYRQLTV